MVKQHYRWDFIGLSTDEKPTPETSENVVDGSTFYCSDTSKLYVFCKDTWYERKALGGGGGGGTSYTAGFGIDIENDEISVDDTEVQPKLTAGDNITITNNTISATGGTTYTAGFGVDITNNEISVDDTEVQPKLTAGTNITIENNTISATGGGSITPVQTTGTSTTDVMSQNAATSMICSDPSSVRRIQIGDSAQANHKGAIAVGWNSKSLYDYTIAIGYNSQSDDNDSISIGRAAKCPGSYQIAIGMQAGANTSSSISNTVALGSYSKATRTGEVNVGVPNYAGSGFNSSNYRVIGGVHDGQDAHDAVTVGQVNSVIDAINTALSTNIPHIGA